MKVISFLPESGRTHTPLTSGLIYIIYSFMRNPYATIPYFGTIIVFSFMSTDISLCKCYILRACARVRFIFELWQLFTAVIIVARNLYFGSAVNR